MTGQIYAISRFSQNLELQYIASQPATRLVNSEALSNIKYVRLRNKKPLKKLKIV